MSDKTTYKVVTLPNRLTLIFVDIPGESRLTLNAKVRVGSQNEAPGEAGFAHLVEHVVFEGTESWATGRDLNLQAMRLGSTIEGCTCSSFTEYELVCLKGDFPKAARIIYEMLFKARFYDHVINTERDVIVREAASTGRPYDEAWRRLMQLMFPEVAPRHPVIGNVQALRGARHSAIRDFYRRHYQPCNVAFAISGSIDEAVITNAIELFSGVMNSHPPEILYKGEADSAKRVVVSQDSGEMMNLIVGFPISQDLFDLPILHMIDGMIGGSPISRLMGKLRQELGLAYYVGSGYDTDPLTTCLYFVTQPLSRDFELVTEVTAREFRQLREDGITESEFEEVKNLTRMQFKHWSANRDYLASLASMRTISGRGLDSLVRFENDLETTSRDEVNKAISSIMASSNTFVSADGTATRGTIIEHFGIQEGADTGPDGGSPDRTSAEGELQNLRIVLGWEDSTESRREVWKLIEEQYENDSRSLLSLMHGIASRGSSISDFVDCYVDSGCSGLEANLMYLDFRTRLLKVEEDEADAPRRESGTNDEIRPEEFNLEPGSARGLMMWRYLVASLDTGKLRWLAQEVRFRNRTLEEFFVVGALARTTDVDALLLYHDFVELRCAERLQEELDGQRGGECRRPLLLMPGCQVTAAYIRQMIDMAEKAYASTLLRSGVLNVNDMLLGRCIALNAIAEAAQHTAVSLELRNPMTSGEDQLMYLCNAISLYPGEYFEEIIDFVTGEMAGNLSTQIDAGENIDLGSVCEKIARATLYRSRAEEIALHLLQSALFSTHAQGQANGSFSNLLASLEARFPGIARSGTPQLHRQPRRRSSL